MKKTWIIVIGIVAAVVIFAAIAWQQQSGISSPAPVAAPPAQEEVGTAAPPQQEQPRAELPFDIETYTSTTTGFAISYPSIYLIKEAGAASAEYGTIPPIVAVSSPDGERQGTNLIESSVVVGASKEKAGVDACDKAQAGETKLGSIEISGTPFTIFTHDGAAAGNFYQTVRYRALRSGACYEITLLMHSGNIGNYPAGTVKEFDRPATLERLKAILYSFRLI